jgi:hypothetical protein
LGWETHLERLRERVEPGDDEGAVLRVVAPAEERKRLKVLVQLLAVPQRICAISTLSVVLCIIVVIEASTIYDKYGKGI